MNIKEKLARWFINKYLPDFHLHRDPGKHPLHRMERNKAVRETLRLDKYLEQGFEDYEERKENGKV